MDSFCLELGPLCLVLDALCLELAPLCLILDPLCLELAPLCLERGTWLSVVIELGICWIWNHLLCLWDARLVSTSTQMGISVLTF